MKRAVVIIGGYAAIELEIAGDGMCVLAIDCGSDACAGHNLDHRS